jgi:hypothetical protein
MKSRWYVPVLVVLGFIALMVAGVVFMSWSDQVTEDLKTKWLGRQIQPANVIEPVEIPQTKSGVQVDSDGYVVRPYPGPFVGEPPLGCICTSTGYCRCCPKGTAPAPAPVHCSFPDGRPWYQPSGEQATSKG